MANKNNHYNDWRCFRTIANFIVNCMAWGSTIVAMYQGCQLGIWNLFSIWQNHCPNPIQHAWITIHETDACVLLSIFSLIITIVCSSYNVCELSKLLNWLTKCRSCNYNISVKLNIGRQHTGGNHFSNRYKVLKLVKYKY